MREIKNMKVLFVTRCLTSTYNDGGLMVTKRNYEMLKSIFGTENVDVIELEKPNILLKLKNIFFRESYGQTRAFVSRYKALLKANNYRFIFFNSSLYGNLVKYCTKLKIPSYVFFHNVESKYYKDLSSYKRSFSSIIFQKYIKALEKQSCQYSSHRIVLNERDKKELFSEYGVNIDLLLPISMKETGCMLAKQNNEEEHFCLFLGSDFYANQHGLSWFIESVVPHINIDVKVAGSICNSLKDKYKEIKGVTFLGYVEDVTSLYNSAEFIVSPIFLGSGMKTKTVEALAFGKSIIGTDEAFIGIKADYSKIGAKCNTADDFINAINSYSGTKFNLYSYEYFKNNLSDESIKSKFESFINSF